MFNDLEVIMLTKKQCTLMKKSTSLRYAMLVDKH